MKRFIGKVALVTGSAQGIGAAIADLLAREGAAVMVADVNGRFAVRRRDDIRKEGGKAECIRVDVGKPADVKRMVRETLRKFGRLDVLVNNVGIGSGKPLRSRPLTDWDKVIAANLRAAYLAAQLAAPELGRRRGSIVNIASTRALQSEPDTEPYSASKGGLLALTHSLAVTLSGKVRVNCILPGWIATDEWHYDGFRWKLTREDHEQHPAGRVGQPEDIAHAALFLASEEAGFITGIRLVVDGGMTVKMIYAE